MEIKSAAYQSETSIKLTLATGEVLSVPVADGNGHYEAIKAWVEAGNKISPIPSPPLAKAKTMKVAEVKAEAKRRIEAIVPQDIQLRILTRGLMLTKRIVDGVATSDEVAEAQAIEDIDTNQLQPIRDASGLIEDEINKKLKVETVLAVDIKNNALWP